ncbi:putative esterase [alpha proteobacterium U9-1i]|nr:putative esterase [alpha proteobacterium U9-1i]
MRAYRAALVAAFVLLAASCATAPPPTTPPTLAALAGDYFPLHSTALGRPMHIYVNLPENYANETQTYSTIYLTDGDSLFPLLAPTQLFLTYDEPIPPAIVVGIAYGTFDPNAGNLRHVDFRVAGSPAFQRFLAEELLPEIERRFRSNPARRVLVGQSRGASFVLYSALTQPDLFWGRIASNPGFQSERDFYDQPAAPASRSDLSLFVASGERDRPALRADALEWFEHWNAKPSRPWALNTVTISNGTHAASIGEAYRQGMLWLFRNEPPAAQ